VNTAVGASSQAIAVGAPPIRYSAAAANPEASSASSVPTSRVEMPVIDEILSSRGQPGKKAMSCRSA